MSFDSRVFVDFVLTVMVFGVASILCAMVVVDYALSEYYKRKRRFLQEMVRAGLSRPGTTFEE